MSDYLCKITKSIVEAERFVSLAKSYLHELKQAGATSALYYPSKTHAAMLRASLDLSGGLSQLRRGKYSE